MNLTKNDKRLLKWEPDSIIFCACRLVFLSTLDGHPCKVAGSNLATPFYAYFEREKMEHVNYELHLFYTKYKNRFPRK